MKTTTKIVKKENVVWSWLFRALTKTFGQRTEERVHLERFNKLPDDALRHIASFLILPRQAMMPTMSKESHKLYQEDLLFAKFMYLIAIEGEDNQNKAENMLKRYPKLISRFISSQRDLTDAAGRHFTQPMSAYEYAFWAGDTRMCRMMEKYMTEEIKANVLKQCKNIEARGVGFTLNGELTENSKHFDFQPIIEAYRAYIAAAMPLVNNWHDEEAWASMDKFWLKIGKELAKVPIHVAQEYCSTQSFAPLEEYIKTLKNLDIKRTVVFYNCLSDKNEFWFHSRRINPNLGISFSIHKWSFLSGMVCRAGLLACMAGQADLRAVSALCQERVIKDIKQTFDNLKPMEPKLQLRLSRPH